MDAFEAFRFATTVSVTNISTEITKIPALPAGSYVITGKVNVDNVSGGSGDVNCQIVAGGFFDLGEANIGNGRRADHAYHDRLDVRHDDRWSDGRHDDLSAHVGHRLDPCVARRDRGDARRGADAVRRVSESGAGAAPAPATRSSEPQDRDVEHGRPSPLQLDRARGTEEGNGHRSVFLSGRDAIPSRAPRPPTRSRIPRRSEAGSASSRARRPQVDTYATPRAATSGSGNRQRRDGRVECRTADTAPFLL